MEKVEPLCLSCQKCTELLEHAWRNICTSCQCPPYAHQGHAAKHLAEVRRSLQSDDEGAIDSKYVWSPPGLTSQEVESYMRSLPGDTVPLKASAGAQKFKLQLTKQLPLSDFLLEFNPNLRGKEDVRAFQAFTDDRAKFSCGMGYADVLGKSQKCKECNLDVTEGSLAVFSEQCGTSAWHPNCFRCSECKELLAELVHCYDFGSLLCVRHYGELEYHRCVECDQLIFASEYTKVAGNYYHMEHYNCSQCSTPLTGKRYVLKQDQPTCLPCYEDKFANKCEKCEKAIGTDFKDLSYKGRHWHEACFLCWGCQNSLANQQFVAKDNGLYCPDCYDGKFAQRCDACTNTFKHGMQKFEYNGKKFHHECFTCVECSQPIGNNSFVPKDEGKLVCMPCYNDKFAQKCGKCGEVLLQGGVTFRETAYHRECFLCTGCDTELANVKFATKDEQPYCPECYIKTFAKICEKCDKPIAGLGQATKYVAFEGRQWHAECFMCNKCDKSLLGQGFLVCEGQVVCPDCGKNM